MNLLKSYLIMVIVALFFTACADNDGSDNDGQPYGSDMVTMTLQISTGQNIQTRAQTGLVNGEGSENKIYDIQVWAFPGGAAANSRPVGYAQMLQIGSGAGAETTQAIYDAQTATVTLQLSIPKEFVDDPSLRLDLYVLGNYRSILPAAPVPGLTKGQLEALSFGGDYFGVNTNTRKPTNTEVEEGKGLPVSAVRKGINLNDMMQVVQNGNPMQLRYLETILLKRAVSRIYFYFSKQTEILGECTVKRVEIDGGLIPDAELVFPNQSNESLPNLPAGVAYNAGVVRFSNANAALPLLADNAIAQTEEPKLLRSDCEENGNKDKTAQEYVNFMHGKATQTTPETTRAGFAYLRETGQKIRGTIYYTYKGTERSKTFEMPRANDFARNHTWFVYAYFSREGLYVCPIVQPWIVGGKLEYQSKTSVQLDIDNTYNSFNYLLYSRDDDYNGTWEDNYCALSYGMWPNNNRQPHYSPWLRIRTTSSNVLKLQTDNPNFGFVVYTEKYGPTEVPHYSDVLDEVEIESGVNVTTDFYVVPKSALSIEGTNPPNRFCHVMLIERTGGMDTGEFTVGRLPWNHKLPGAESGETAQFYYVTPQEYVDRNSEGHELIPQ